MITLRLPHGDETLDLEAFERRVAEGRVPPETLIRFPPVTGERWVPARELEFYEALFRPEHLYFRRYFSLSRFPWITAGLVLVSVALYAVMRARMAAEGGGVDAWMVRFGAKAEPLIDDLGQTWRLLTANLVHRDLLHLLLNLLFLFNVGGALENAYRRVDYLLVLTASALGTTLTSMIGSDVVSAGASGVLFGCFGGLVVFGLKYRRLIPQRFRRFFGGSVLPYALVFLWLGWMSVGVDNWGHLGGLAAGTAATLTLTPRLLQRPGASRRALRRGAALALAVVAVVALGPAWSAVAGRLVPEVDPASGLAFRRPAGWQASHGVLGHGFTNALPEPTGVYVLSEPLRGEVDLTQVADAWFRGQLHAPEGVGRLRRVRRSAPRHTRVAGRPALAYQAAFESSAARHAGTDFVLEVRLFTARGRVHALVFLTPEDRFRAYAPTFEAVVDSVRVPASPGP